MRAHARRGPIKWRSSLHNTIYDVLESKKDWVETDNENEWDFFWADKGCVLWQPAACTGEVHPTSQREGWQSPPAASSSHSSWREA